MLNCVHILIKRFCIYVTRISTSFWWEWVRGSLNFCAQLCHVFCQNFDFVILFKCSFEVVILSSPWHVWFPEICRFSLITTYASIFCNIFKISMHQYLLSYIHSSVQEIVTLLVTLLKIIRQSGKVPLWSCWPNRLKTKLSQCPSLTQHHGISGKFPFRGCALPIPRPYLAHTSPSHGPYLAHTGITT